MGTARDALFVAVLTALTIRLAVELLARAGTDMHRTAKEARTRRAPTRDSDSGMHIGRWL